MEAPYAERGQGGQGRGHMQHRHTPSLLRLREARAMMPVSLSGGRAQTPSPLLSDGRAPGPGFHRGNQ